MSKRLAAAAIATVCLVSSSVLAGPALDRARAALDELRYEDAATALDEALREGANAPEATAEIYRLIGEVSAALGDRQRAVDAFDRLLALDPDAALREGVSPKLQEPFDEARARAGAREPLSLRCAIADDAIEVQVTTNPLGMAVAAYQSGSGAVDTAELDGGNAVIVVVDPVLVESVGLLDEHGNRLVAVAAAACEQEMAAPGRRGTATRGREARDGGGSIAGHWALWGGVAVGFAAAGTYFALDTRAKVDELDEMVANSSAYEYAEARALEDDARRSALFANIGFAAAGVTAIVSGVLLYRDRERATERANLTVAPTVGPGGAGVRVGVRF